MTMPPDITDAESFWGIGLKLMLGNIPALARKPGKPVLRPKITSGNTGALTTLTLDVKGPHAGKCWFVYRVGVFGTDLHTAVSGVADVFVGPNPQSVDFQGGIFSALPIPSIVEDNDGHNPVMHGDLVYAIFSNVPTNQNLVLAVNAYEYDIADVFGMSL